MALILSSSKPDLLAKRSSRSAASARYQFAALHNKILAILVCRSGMSYMWLATNSWRETMESFKGTFTSMMYMYLSRALTATSFISGSFRIPVRASDMSAWNIVAKTVLCAARRAQWHLILAPFPAMMVTSLSTSSVSIFPWTAWGSTISRQVNLEIGTISVRDIVVCQSSRGFFHASSKSLALLSELKNTPLGSRNSPDLLVKNANKCTNDL